MTDTGLPRPRRRKWPYIVGALLLVTAIGANIGGDDDTPAAEPAVTESAPSPAPDTETPAPIDVMFTVSHDGHDLDGAIPGGVTTVTFDVPDNFSAGLIASGAERATLDAIQHALAEHPGTGRVVVEGTFPTTDDHGNTTDTAILRPFYDRETIDRIDFDNHPAVDVWGIRDGGQVHPDLLD